MGIRSRLPERGDGRIDERGVFAGKAVVSETERVHPSGRERLDENIGVPRKRSQRVRAVGRGNVELDAALVDAVSLPKQTRARPVPRANERTAPPRGASAGRLNLNHVRAKVRKQLAAPLEPALGKVEDGVRR